MKGGPLCFFSFLRFFQEEMNKINLVAQIDLGTGGTAYYFEISQRGHTFQGTDVSNALNTATHIAADFFRLLKRPYPDLIVRVS